jgi:Tfp pilus assembly protein FimV
MLHSFAMINCRKKVYRKAFPGSHLQSAAPAPAPAPAAPVPAALAPAAPASAAPATAAPSPAAPTPAPLLSPPPGKLPPNLKPQVVGPPCAVPDEVGSELVWQEVYDRRHLQRSRPPSPPRHDRADREAGLSLDFKRRTFGLCFRCLASDHFVADC